MESHKWGLGGKNVRGPYYYLIEIERLLPKDPRLKNIMPQKQKKLEEKLCLSNVM